MSIEYIHGPKMLQYFYPNPRSLIAHSLPSHTKAWERLPTFLQLFNLFWSKETLRGIAQETNGTLRRW